MRTPTFSEICSMAAARLCLDSGQSVAEIAASGKVSHAKVKAWLRATRPGQFGYGVPAPEVIARREVIHNREQHT